MRIKGRSAHMTKLPLVTVRPFEFGEVVLSEHDELQGDNPEGVDRFLRNHVSRQVASLTHVMSCIYAVI